MLAHLVPPRVPPAPRAGTALRRSPSPGSSPQAAAPAPPGAGALGAPSPSSGPGSPASHQGSTPQRPCTRPRAESHRPVTSHPVPAGLPSGPSTAHQLLDVLPPWQRLSTSEDMTSGQRERVNSRWDQLADRFLMSDWTLQGRRPWIPTPAVSGRTPGNP